MENVGGILLKKFKVLAIFVLVISLFTPITGQAAGFNDVSSGYTFYDEVEFLSSEQIITGYTDGTFKPDNVVTRAQAAIMIGRALGLNGDPKNTKFNDVTASVTGSGYIASAVEKGIISGFTDKTYRPNEPVTRGQMAIFLNRAFTLTEGQVNSFNDVSPNMAAYQSIINVAVNGIASGYSDETYRPNQPVNRGQFSAFMARTLEPSFRSLAAMTVQFLAVGQGDAILIQYPNGQTALVDAGRSSSAIAAALTAANITKIDTFIATHPDADHIGGADYVIKNYGVTKVIDSGQTHTTQTFLKYLETIDASGAEFIVPSIGDNISDDASVTAKVLAINSNAADLNDGSIVIMLSYGLTDFLLTSDAGLDVEEFLLAEYADLEAEILKVSHHGAATGTGGDFIEAVDPWDAILSYGNNSYGHPNDGVVQDLLNYDANLYSTHEQGTIEVRTVGNSYAINVDPWGAKPEPVPAPKPEPKPEPNPDPKPAPQPKPDINSGTYVIPGAPTSFQNCTAMREYYPSGVQSSHPAYASKHDRDKDGWACER